MGKRLAGALVLVLGVAAFAGPAFAGNGNGGGNGDNGKTDTSVAPGSSAAAPGQLKKDDGASSQTTTTTTATTTTTTVSAGSDAAPAGQGVKPANDTAHDTRAPASSTKTKLYGNGHNAGEIAIRNGAAPSTVLHGPGNSHPHKASPCAGHHHEVDVHALKAKRHGHGCGSVSEPPGSNPEPHPGHTSDPGGPSSPHPSMTDPKSHSGSPRTSHRVRGSEPVSRTPAAVRATVQRPAGATLPFTGFPLWLGVVLGAVLLGLGLTLSLLAGRETEREVSP
jgi:hypothetical protein